MRVLVTGATGFLGGALARALAARGETVRTFSRSPAEDLRALGLEVHRGDLADRDAVEKAVEGCDLVFHCGALAGLWGRHEDYVRANVLGTTHVLEGCARHGVRRLVYTSSPSVVFAGGDLSGVDESAPYATSFLASYPETKAQAERLVRSANGPSLATVALRPHLIWGPGDRHLFPRIVERARKGRLARLGKVPKLVDCVYIDNAVYAHLLAAERLAPGSPIAGRAYFISQDEPIPVFELVDRFLLAASVPKLTRTVPAGLAYGVGGLLERIYGLLRIQAEPPMTRFLAKQLATEHWFNIAAAKRDLGYEPVISIEEGLRRLSRSVEGGAGSAPK